MQQPPGQQQQHQHQQQQYAQQHPLPQQHRPAAGAPPGPPAVAPAAVVDPALRNKYAHTRVLARAPPLEAPVPGRLLPAAIEWFARLRVPPAILELAGVGMASVEHPRDPARGRVAAIALPHRSGGQLVDVRYYTLDGQGQLQDTWLAHGVGHLYALTPDALAASGDVVIVGSELAVLALAAAGVPAALAVPQRLGSWRDGTVAYQDARARAQPLRDHIGGLRKEMEAREAAEDEAAAKGGSNSLAAALGLTAAGAHAGSPAPAPAARKRSPRRPRRGASAAAAAPGMALLLPNADSAVLALDDTPAEQQLAAELAGLLGAARCRGVSWPRGWEQHVEAPPEEALLQGDGARRGVLDVYQLDGPDVLLTYLKRAYTWPVEGIERFGDYGVQLLDAFEGRLEQQQAHSTTWPSVDELFKVTPGELTLVTGVPNSGKSEWLDALAVNLAKAHGWRFALCSLEKRPRDHARQLVEKIAGKPMLRAAYAGDRPRMTPEELEAAFDWLDRHFVVINASDEAMPALDWVLEKARAAVVKYGVRGLIIDPYNELDHSRPVGKNEHEYISEFMARLRQFAKGNACHVFLVAHPKQRANWRGEAPNLMDISGGANFFAKCDNGIVVHRDWSQLNQIRAAGRQQRGGGGSAARGEGAMGAPQAAAAGGGGPAAAAAAAPAPFMGFTVEIQVQKVRSKTAGTRGIALLEYDAASGQYHEVGQGPAGGGASSGGEGAGSAGGAWRAREGPDGGLEAWDEEDEGAEGLDGGEEEGGAARADDDRLLGEQWDGEVLEFVGRRAAALRRDAALAAADEVHDLTRAREGAAAAGGEEREADWTTEDR